MKRLVLSGFLASEEIYINQLEALLLVIDTSCLRHTHTQECVCVGSSLVANRFSASRPTAEFFPGTQADIAYTC